jgi:hypothetical protein
LTRTRKSLADIPRPVHSLLSRINGLHRAMYGDTVGLEETLQLMVIQEARRRGLRIPQEALQGFKKVPNEAVMGTFQEHEGTEEVQ